MLGWFVSLFVSRITERLPVQFSLNLVEGCIVVQETTHYILERIQIRWIHTVIFTYVIANCLYYNN